VAHPDAALEVGTQIATTFAGDTKALTTLLANTSKALGTSTFAAVNSFENFVSRILNDPAAAVPTKETFVKLAAEKVAASNPTAAGAFFGGLVLNSPLDYNEQGELQTLAGNVLSDAKLKKAIGEILATTTDQAGIDQSAIAAGLASNKLFKANAAVIAQGLIRAAITPLEVGEIFNAVNAAAPITNRTTFAKTAAIRTGDALNNAKVSALATALVDGQTALQKATITSAVVGAVGITSPDAGADVTAAVLAGPTGEAINTDLGRTAFGVKVISTLKAYAAAGFVAQEIVRQNSLDTTGTPDQVREAVAIFTGPLMAKGTKAAADIAQQVARLTNVSSTGLESELADFANRLSDQNKGKFTSQTAVGISIVNPNAAGAITVAAITHDPGLDKSSLAKTASIAGAVAKAVDEESAADVGEKIATAMSNLGTAIPGKPIKLSLAAAVATALAKAVQDKPGVRLANRMDELGEIAAAVTKGVLGQTTTLTDAARSKLIVGIGSAVLKALSKTARLSNTPTAAPLTAGLVAATQTFKADLWEARDIAGSIANVIKLSGLTDTQKEALLGTANNGTTAGQGPLLTAFLKLSGKKGSATYNAVLEAFALVRAQGAGVESAIFEKGADPDKETDNKNG
jgi:hypothetical protein